MPPSPSAARKKAFAAHMVELMAGFAPVQARPMFGGYGIYWQGLMFALIAQEQLYFKCDAQSEAAFASRGLARFTYDSPSRTVSLPYCAAPAEVYDEPEQMATWARMAYDCAVRQNQAKPSPKPHLTPKRGLSAPPVSASKATKATKPAKGLAALPNLGPQSQAMLAKAGIRTEAQLRQAGAVLAYARTKAVCKQASLTLLWALEGALTGRDWREVAASDRAALLMALEDVQRHM